MRPKLCEKHNPTQTLFRLQTIREAVKKKGLIYWHGYKRRRMTKSLAFLAPWVGDTATVRLSIDLLHLPLNTP